MPSSASAPSTYSANPGRRPRCSRHTSCPPSTGCESGGGRTTHAAASDRQRPDAGVAGSVVRAERDRVRAGAVGDVPVHRERTARRHCHGGAGRDADAVVDEAPTPLLADAVHVDLGPDLEGAVVVLGLQLPGAAGRAGTALLDAATAAGGGGRGGGGGRAEHAQGERSGDGDTDLRGAHDGFLPPADV